MQVVEYEKKIVHIVCEAKAHACPVELKSLDDDGQFAGYASVFGLVDNQRDVVLSGAFYKSILQRAREIKLLWQHHPNEPIGYFTEMFEDSRGLYVEGRLMLEVERAREAYSLLKQGVVKGLSIGYSPVRYATDPDTGVRKLAEVDLWEISLVTFPANAQANVTIVKGMEDQQCGFSDAEWAAFRKVTDYAIRVVTQ